MTCAMVILNYKDSQRARVLAERCMKYESIEKIVIVDNCSNDGSYEYLNEICNKKINVISSSKNGGFGFGNNVGARYLIQNYTPQYILFANTDTIFPETNIIKCLAALDYDRSLGVVSTRMKGPTGEEQNSSWEFATYKEHLLGCFWLHRRKKYLMKKNIRKEYEASVTYVDVVRGSFMMFRTEALERAGFFDENVFLYAEEVIIASKLKQAGYRAGLVTDLWYIHDHYDIVESNKGYNSLKRLQRSAYYYQCKYRNITPIQRILMKICMLWGGFEQKIIDMLKK